MSERAPKIPRLDRVGRLFVAASIRRRVPVFVIAILLLCLFGYLASGLRVNESLEDFFIEGDEARLTYDELVEVFGSDSSIFAAVEISSPVSEDDLRRIERIRLRLEAEVPHLAPGAGVTCLTSFPYLTERDGDLALERTAALDPARAAAVMEDLRASPLYRHLIVSKDGRLAGFFIPLEPPADGGEEDWQAKATEAVERVLATCGLDENATHLAGLPVLATAYSRASREETRWTSAVALAVIAVLLGVFFRSVRGVILPMLTVVATLIVTMGAVGVFSSFNMSMSILPPLILALSVAMTVHLVSAARAEGGGGPNNALDAASEVFAPTTMAALTTALGFCAMVAAPVAPVRLTGIFAAVGVLVAFVLTFTLAPSLLSLLDKRPARGTVDGPLSGFLAWLARVIHRRRVLVLIVGLLIAASSAIGLSRIRVETDWVAKFPKSSRPARDYATLDRQFAGTTSFSLLLSAREAGHFNRLEAMRDLDELAAWIESQPEVTSTLHAAQVLKRASGILYGTNATSFALPTSEPIFRDVALALEELGTGAAGRLVSPDGKRAVINVRTMSLSNEALERTLERISARADELLGDGVSARPTGRAVLSLIMFSSLTRSQVVGFAAVLLAIFVIISVTLRSARLGLVAMIPNLLPLAATGAVMGLFDIPLDVSTVLIASIAIGIAVDDTVHICVHMRRRLATSGSYEQATAETLRRVGRPVLLSTLVLAAGFFSLGVSSMANISRFGLLSGLTVVFAFLGDVLLLPALIAATRALGRADDGGRA